MTLVELLVGLVIAGLASTAGYAAFASLTDHRHRAERVSDAVARAAAIRHSLGSWLSGARLSVEQDAAPFRGLDAVTENDVPDDQLSFLTTSATPLGKDATVVRLFVDRDPNTPQRGLTAEFTQWRGSRMQVIEIDPQITGLELRFVSRLLGRERWMPSWISSSVLPVGLEMTLIAEQPDSLAPLLRLPMRVAFGAGR